MMVMTSADDDDDDAADDADVDDRDAATRHRDSIFLREQRGGQHVLRRLWCC